MTTRDSLRHAPAARTRTPSTIAAATTTTIVAKAADTRTTIFANGLATTLAVYLAIGLTIGLSSGCESDGRPVSSKPGTTKSSVSKSRANWDSSPGATR